MNQPWAGWGWGRDTMPARTVGSNNLTALETEGENAPTDKRSFTWKERLGKQDVLRPGSGEINTE